MWVRPDLLAVLTATACTWILSHLSLSIHHSSLWEVMYILTFCRSSWPERKLMESQNAWDWKGPQDVIQSSLLLNARSTRLAGLPRTVPSQVLNASGNRDSTTFRQSVPVFSHPQCKMPFCYVQIQFLVFNFMPIASSLFMRYHEMSLTLHSLLPPFRYSYTMTRFAVGLFFSKLNSPSSLGFSSDKTCSSCFIIFVAPCWVLSNMSMSLF